MEKNLTSSTSPQDYAPDDVRDGTITYIRPQARENYDTNVTLEEYHYYAQKTRAEQDTLEKPKTPWGQLMGGKKQQHQPSGDAEAFNKHGNLSKRENRLEITDEEWTNASRAYRTASAGACFYLITTDILGPFAVPIAIGTLGWGPGIGLFTAFGFMAGYSGYLIWRVFMGVDSYEFSARNYGDLAFRTWGTPARHVVNFMQALALLLLLGQVTILFGLNISAMSKFKLCYVICPLIFVIAGFAMTQIRTLKSYGWVATFAIWLNLLVMFINMGVMSHTPPNYAISGGGSVGSVIDPTTITPDANGVYPKLVHYSALPVHSLVGSIGGLLNGVLAYAGAQLFVEFMAEMRRPGDFLKAMWGAQIFIWVVYLVYGCFVYYYQGQYTFNPSFQGVSTYGWQTVGNSLTLVAGLIAAGLYGNIGIKVFYNNVLLDIFKAPPLISKQGKFIYSAIVPIWWSIAFLIAAAIPDYFGFVGVISASTLLNMTYTIPPFLALGFDIQKHATRSHRGEGFNPITGEVRRGGTTVQRWMRGFISGGLLQVSLNVWHLLYFLASLSLCGLGMYASVDGMIEAFKQPQVNSFQCRSPLQG